MIKAFKTFWKDYNDMCVKPQAKWMKLHWKGYILMLILSGAGGYAYGAVLEKRAIKKRESFNYMIDNEDEEA